MALAPHHPDFALWDSLPLPACLFAHARRCQRFRGEAAFGKDTLLKQTFCGFRIHLRVCWPGLITRFFVAPANAYELSAVPELLECTSGVVLGDRNYWSRETKAELAKRDPVLLTPYQHKGSDQTPRGAPS